MIDINPVDCLYHLVSQVRLVITSELKKGFKEAGAGQVKPSYLGVLISLWKEDGLRVVELGRRAGLEPSTMTGLLDRMVRDGLLLRQADPGDRRSLKIVLTQEGRDLMEPVMETVEQILGQVFRHLKEDEHDLMVEMLKKVLKNYGRTD